MRAEHDRTENGLRLTFEHRELIVSSYAVRS